MAFATALMDSLVATTKTPKPGFFFTNTSSGPQNTETKPRAFCGARGRFPGPGLNPELAALLFERLSG
eukprot:13235086-Alexandrium_andersonii.AAC.1